MLTQERKTKQNKTHTLTLSQREKWKEEVDTEEKAADTIIRRCAIKCHTLEKDFKPKCIESDAHSLQIRSHQDHFTTAYNSNNNVYGLGRTQAEIIWS